ARSSPRYNRPDDGRFPHTHAGRVRTPVLRQLVWRLAHCRHRLGGGMVRPVAGTALESLALEALLRGASLHARPVAVLPGGQHQAIPVVAVGAGWRSGEPHLSTAIAAYRDQRRAHAGSAANR